MEVVGLAARCPGQSQTHLPPFALGPWVRVEPGLGWVVVADPIVSELLAGRGPGTWGQVWPVAGGWGRVCWAPPLRPETFPGA